MFNSTFKIHEMYYPVIHGRRQHSKKQQKNPAITERIRQDYEEGIRLGVRGTPTIFINGKKLRDRSMKSMEAVIEKELQKQQEKSQKNTAQ